MSLPVEKIIIRNPTDCFPPLQNSNLEICLLRPLLSPSSARFQLLVIFLVHTPLHSSERVPVDTPLPEPHPLFLPHPNALSLHPPIKGRTGGEMKQRRGRWFPLGNDYAAPLRPHKFRKQTCPSSAFEKPPKTTPQRAPPSFPPLPKKILEKCP